MWETIDNYCERLAPDFWAEPVNAITNAAFLLAAFALLRCYRGKAMHDKPVLLLIFMVALVGMGSFLFHTFANGLTLWMDVVPIMLFVLLYLFFAQRRFFGSSKAKAGLWLLVFVGLAVLAAKTPEPYRFNGSVEYFPCLLALVVIAALVKMPQVAKLLWLSAAVFTVSLTFRSIDMAMCDSLALGTHFLWHCFNGALLYLLVRALMAAEQPDGCK
jgi:hypothetical protein